MDAASSKTVGWFAGRIPDGWFTGPPEVTYDRDEVLVVGTIPAPDLGEDADEEARAAAVQSRIEAFREETRAQRMAIADAAEARFDRKVAWGIECDGVKRRVHQPQRAGDDAAADAGAGGARHARRCIGGAVAVGCVGVVRAARLAAPGRVDREAS